MLTMVMPSPPRLSANVPECVWKSVESVYAVWKPVGLPLQNYSCATLIGLCELDA